MDWLNILNEIFELCVIPLLTLGIGLLIYYIKAKLNIAKSNADNEVSIKYLSVLEDVVVDCLQATNQTYVNALKDKNAFDGEAQKSALLQTRNAVMRVISNDVKEHLGSLFGDLETLVTEKIEANIDRVKK